LARRLGRGEDGSLDHFIVEMKVGSRLQHGKVESPGVFCSPPPQHKQGRETAPHREGKPPQQGEGPDTAPTQPRAASVSAEVPEKGQQLQRTAAIEERQEPEGQRQLEITEVTAAAKRRARRQRLADRVSGSQ